MTIHRAMTNYRRNNKRPLRIDRGIRDGASSKLKMIVGEKFGLDSSTFRAAVSFPINEPVLMHLQPSLNRIRCALEIQSPSLFPVHTSLFASLFLSLLSHPETQEERKSRRARTGRSWKIDPVRVPRKSPGNGPVSPDSLYVSRDTRKRQSFHETRL